MRYGVEVINAGPYADPQAVVRVAQTAEAAGWEGLWVWDHLAFVWDGVFGDPWVTLAAVAASTTRLRLGTAVTPLARHRPQVLAHALATLDLLSAGRVVLGAGLGGVPAEFSAFGEPGEPTVRAAMLDEALGVVARLWSGEEVRHRGAHYRVEGVRLAPLPVQRPRIPIWIGGESPPALRRAARWDGWIVDGVGGDGRTMTKTPADLARATATLRSLRAAAAGDAPFEIALSGYSAPTDGAQVRAYEEAGLTWWLEGVTTRRGSMEDMLERVAAGPPR